MKIKKRQPKPTGIGKNPYKWLHSYEEGDKEVFCGRDAEASELFQLVKRNFLTVVTGKAGIGKTSLLNAGGAPMLRESGFLPIRLRLNYSKDAKPLREQIRQAILEELKNSCIEIKTSEKGGGEDPGKPYEQKETLWEYFWRSNHYEAGSDKSVIPVLVFDQFEEVFTLGKERLDTGTLNNELHELFESQSSPIPAALPNFRVVISVREDYLLDIIESKSPLAAIDKEIFRLTNLNGKQAREIIGIGFQDEDLVKDILSRFSPERDKNLKSVPLEKLEIEPTFLSLLCFQLFEKRELKSTTKKDQDKILADFYDSVMKDFPRRVEEFIETNLLTEGGFRTPCHLAQGHPLAGYIHQLVERRILRKGSWGDGEYFEIIHDTLTPIILEKRDRNINKAKNRLLVLVSLIALVFFFLTWNAIVQWNRADEQYENVLELQVTSMALQEFHKDSTKAIRTAEVAYKMGLPNPHERTYQALATVGYSSLTEPFYSTYIQLTKPVYAGKFSPDGQLILASLEDNTAKLWRLDGTLQADLTGHTERIMSVVFSPDSKRILTASLDKTAKLWDWQSKLLSAFEHRKAVAHAIFSRDGEQILTASWDGTAKLWDAQGKLLETFTHEAAVSYAMFSPDNTRIVTASWDKTAKLWSLQGKLLAIMKHNGALSAAVFSPDGSRILTASRDNSAGLWDLHGNRLAELGHKFIVSDALYSPDGEQILTASQDGVIKIWSDKGKLIRELDKHIDKISSVEFSPNSSRIVSASRDGTVRIQTPEAKLLVKLNNFDTAVSSASFSPDGRRFLTTCADGTLKVWTIKSDILISLDKHSAGVNTAVYSSDGSKIVTASGDHTAKIWGADSSLLADLNRHEDVVTSALFFPDSKRIVTTSNDNTAKIWSLEGKLLANLDKHRDAVTFAAISPNGELILTASWDKSIKLWDRDGKLLVDLNLNEKQITSAVFSSDSKLILATFVEGLARVYDLTGKDLLDLVHTDIVTSALFSRDSRFILTASRDHTARLWSFKGELLDELKHKGPVTTVAISPDDTRILTASWDNTARLWDFDGHLLAVLDEHRDAVASAVFSPDGSSIVTASHDHTAKLWDLNGDLLADLDKHRDIVNSASFSPDGSRIITSSQDRTAYIWYTPEAIYEWLKKSNIPPLNKEDRRKLGIR
jgi:WD40 repeat protein